MQVVTRAVILHELAVLDGGEPFSGEFLSCARNSLLRCGAADVRMLERARGACDGGRHGTRTVRESSMKTGLSHARCARLTDTDRSAGDRLLRVERFSAGICGKLAALSSPTYYD